MFKTSSSRWPLTISRTRSENVRREAVFELRPRVVLQWEPRQLGHKVFQGIAISHLAIDLIDWFAGSLINDGGSVREQMLDRDRLVRGNSLRGPSGPAHHHFWITNSRNVIRNWIEQPQFPLFKKSQCRNTYNNLGHRINPDNCAPLHRKTEFAIAKTDENESATSPLRTNRRLTPACCPSSTNCWMRRCKRSSRAATNPRAEASPDGRTPSEIIRIDYNVLTRL